MPKRLRAATFCGLLVSRRTLRKPRWWSIWAARRSEEHTSELQSLMRISYAVFCLKIHTLVTDGAIHHRYRSVTTHTPTDYKFVRLNAVYAGDTERAVLRTTH